MFCEAGSHGLIISIVGEKGLQRPVLIHEIRQGQMVHRVARFGFWQLDPAIIGGENICRLSDFIGGARKANNVLRERVAGNVGFERFWRIPFGIYGDQDCPRCFNTVWQTLQRAVDGYKRGWADVWAVCEAEIDETWGTFIVCLGHAFAILIDQTDRAANIGEGSGCTVRPSQIGFFFAGGEQAEA